MRLRLTLHPLALSWRLALAGLLLLLAGLSAVGGGAAHTAPGDARAALAQQATETPRPTITPPPGPITIPGALPACQISYVAGTRAEVRACAGSGCPLITTLPQYEVVCIRGVTGNPDWLIVSLTTTDISAPLYAIQASAIAPGPLPSDTELFQDCFQFWQVAPAVRANVNVRQCPSLDCPVMGTLQPGDWVCVQTYGGEYEDWLRADIPGGLRGVWISDEVMQVMDIDSVPTLASQAAAQVVTVTATLPPTPLSTTPPSATPPTTIFQVGGTPDVTATPTASLTATETPALVCQVYVIDVAGAAGGNVRSCPATTCDIVGTFPQNTPLCVLGPAEQTGWLIVDLAPADPNNPLSYVSENVVRREGELSQISTPVILPTATPLPTLPVCEPGSEQTGCVTPTPTPLLTPPPPPPVEPIGPLLAQEVTLARLRVPNMELVSPVGFTQFRFYVPDDWVIDGNNVLYLDLDYFEMQGTRRIDAGRVDLVSSLDIYLDDQLAAAVSLDQKTLGRQTLAIPLPLAALSDQVRRSHVVQVRFRAEDHCLDNGIAQVFIRAEQSYFHFEFREGRPLLDLAFYPRPIYNQRFAGEGETAIIVLPDQPVASDYEVAMALAAGLGARTFNSLRLEVTTAAQLSEQDRLSRNLLLVGQIGTNSLIDRYYAENRYPTVRTADGQVALNADPVGPDEGIVQVIANPDNDKLAVVTVTGQTPEALRKAGQALAGPPSVMGIGGPVAIVTGAQPVVRPPVGVTQQTTFTFTELGEPQITMGGYGISTAEIRFYMPAGYTLTDDAAVELVFNYAEVLEGSRATIALFLNGDVPLTSSYLNLRQTHPEALGGPYRLRARIPASAVLPGETNALQIIVAVQGDWNCYPPDSTIGWVTILGDSTINLPRQQQAPGAVEPLVGWFPAPFNSQVDMRNVWVSLSERPTLDEATQAARVVSRIASSVTSGEGFAPRVSLGNLPEGVDLAQYHLMVFGRHTTNPFLAALNDKLPQPFVVGTDDLQQTLDDVTFRLPVGYEIGVLQTLPSPWHAERVILVITGSGPRGQANAAAALYDFLYGRAELLGDVVFISDYAVSAINTRVIRDAEAFVEVLNELEAEATAQASITPTLPPLEATATAALMLQAVPTEAAVTITPFPTMTLVPSLTPGPTATATPFFTPTPPPTIASPIPTFAPLAETDLQGETLEPPEWFEILLIAAFIVVLSTLIFGLLKLRRRGRRNVV